MKKNKKHASITVYVFALISIFLAFCAFAIDGAIVFTTRMKLQNITEIIAMSAASEYNATLNASNTDKSNAVSNAATNAFNILSKDGLNAAKLNISTNPASNKVLIKTTMIAQPFFLAFLGVNGINIEAKACAVSQEKPIKSNYTGINWVTPNATYFSDILSKNLNFNDTAILLPLGQSLSASYDSKLINFNLIDSEDSQPLSLGPGGFITIKLPAPIVDKTGYDLFIKEAGDSLEGYMVFAGLDNNPKNPYSQKDNEGDGISWVNISCSATPEKTDSNGYLKSYTIPTDNLGAQAKFYGSAYFDIGNSCTGGISMAKYIRIVDDNDESALVTDGSGAYYKAMMYGESSSATSGADIDSVKVLNYVELIPSSEF